MIQIIDTTKELKTFCKKLEKQPFITVDTEFMREKTYYPILCLIQVACADEKLAACIDPLAPDMDLSALLDIMKNEKVLKVFHSARQDLEIFYQLMNELPSPLFDTQVGAMVCGLGESVSYHGLVSHFLGVDLDKSSRVTDWSARPLLEKQIDYAMGDVTYLVQIYEKMIAQLHAQNRTDWVKDEMKAVINPALYDVNPMDAWHRLKPASTQGKYLAVLQAVCAWREERAMYLNRPRRHILRDETVLELAALAPQTTDDLKHFRGKLSLKSEQINEILNAIQIAVNLPDNEQPKLLRDKTLTPAEQAVKEILRLLLTIISSDLGVAAKLIASSEDLGKMAKASKADVPAMSGWRFEVFGQKAMAFKDGKLSLSFDKKTKRIIFENR